MHVLSSPTVSRFSSYQCIKFILPYLPAFYGELTSYSGYGPHVEPDTVEAFEFHEEAKSAEAPAGCVQTFVDLNASVSANTTTPAQCPGWQPPQQCGGDGSKGHDHPSTCIGTGFFPGPYNPAICAAYAEAQNAVNEKSSIWQKWIQIFTGNYNPLKCDFFNSYMLKKNEKALGTYCGLYSQQHSAGEATYVPGWQGADFWSIESSWSF